RPLLGAFDWQLPLTRRQRPYAVYYVALAQLIAMFVGLVLLLRSLFGRVLDGIRVNEHRMQALGFNTYRYKLAAFVIAGLLAGVAGHMWAMHRGFVNPELVGWHRSAEALLMILIGGLGTLHGPIIGALAFPRLLDLPQVMEDGKPFATIFNAIGLPKVGAFLQPLSERKLLLEGIVILLVVLVLPKGLSGISMPRWLRDKISGSTSARVTPAST